MFNLLKKKETEPTVLAPCDGRIIPLEQVQDTTFSQKMMGDGFAVMPAGEYIVAPFKGTVLMVFPTLHAIGLRAKKPVTPAAAGSIIRCRRKLKLPRRTKP